MWHFSLQGYFFVKKDTEFESEFSSGMYLLYFGLKHPKQERELDDFEGSRILLLSSMTDFSTMW